MTANNLLAPEAADLSAERHAEELIRLREMLERLLSEGAPVADIVRAEAALCLLIDNSFNRD